MSAMFFLILNLLAKPAFAANSCSTFYEDLYSKPVLETVFALGYGDNDEPGGNWSDGEYADFLEKITSPCLPGEQACDFKADPEDATEFTKTIIVYGSEKTIHLKAVKGSTDVAAMQERQSAVAREVFMNGLKSADVVLYDGHSRNGGGPDFYPAHRAANGHIDYPWYQRNRPGLKDMYSAFADTRHPAKVLALYSCLSKQHYLKWLRAHAPHTDFILTNRLTLTSEGLASISHGINSLLNLSCKDEMERTRPNDALEFYGFF